MLWLVAALVHTLLCLVAVTDVAARPMTVRCRVGWLTAIVLAPLIGIGLYAVYGRRGIDGSVEDEEPDDASEL